MYMTLHLVIGLQIFSLNWHINMGTHIYHTLCVLLVFAASCNAAKILFQPMGSVKSHFVYFSRLAAALAEEGHETSMLVPSNLQLPKSMLRGPEIITFEVPDAVPFASSPEFSAMIVEYAFAESFIEMIEVLRRVKFLGDASFFNECQSLFENVQLIKTLVTANFDLVVSDVDSLSCGYALPYKLGVPHVPFSVPLGMWMLRVPALPSFVPLPATEYTDRMSFPERLKSVFSGFAMHMLMNATDYYTRTYVPEKPALTTVEMLKRSSLYFTLTDPVLSYPMPSMPNTIEIGDIMARSGEPLPEDLKNFVDGSKNGVIVVAFGSYLDHLPPDILCKIARALSRMPQSVIWKQKALQCEVPSNVKLMSWIPQNDLLAHPNTRLFISHCGLNSFIEAVSHGAPILALPIALDQPFNAKVVQTRGYGLRLEFKNFTEDELVDTINIIITDRSFKENITKASNIFKNKPISAGKRASFWINHILKYGDDHLRTKAVDLNDIQFFMIDIFAFVVSVLLVVLIVAVCCCRFIWAQCFSRFCSSRKKKSKVE